MSERPSQEKIIEIMVKALDSKKAEDIKVIKITDLTVIADYFVIANGTSNTQVRALADEVEFKLKENGIVPERTEGNGGTWHALDYGDIIVHIFTRDQRDFYSLERLWKDGEEVDISSILTDK